MIPTFRFATTLIVLIGGQGGIGTVHSWTIHPSNTHNVHSLYKQRRITRTMILNMSSSPSSLEEEARKLQEQAQKLRQDIESFQRQKDKMEETERQRMQNDLDQKRDYLERYSAVVPILKPDGTTVEERVQFPPRLNQVQEEENDTATDTESSTTSIGSTSSTILVYEAMLPLGILLGEDDTVPGIVRIDEIGQGSNGELAGLQVGDVVRACTACRVQMDQPMWQLMAGGIGRPKTMRFMFGIDNQPFEQVMEAIGSNRMDPQGRSVLLVIERLV